MKTIIIALMIFALMASVFALVGCAAFGTIPAGGDLARMQASPQYDKAGEQFDNLTPGVLEEVDANAFNLKLLYDFFFVDGERSPDDPLPQVSPDLVAFAQTSGSPEVVWFGHSSLLLRMAEKNILLDPVFSGRASPVPFSVGRFQEPVATLEDLPEIDFIVISHDHYDHLDMETVKFFANRKAQFLVPLGVGSHLKGWGVPPERIIELDWWDDVRCGALEFVATPARHFSGRGLRNRNSTLWASWVIRDAERSVYFSGDSGYGRHFREIGDKYGPFDAAFIETGQYNNRWRGVHMMPEESAQAYFDLRAELVIPIHWGMFELSMHTWYQPAMEIHAQARQRGIRLVTPMLGQVVNLDNPQVTSAWWEPWVDPDRPAEWYAQKVN